VKRVKTMRNNLIKQKKPSEIKEEFHGVNKSLFNREKEKNIMKKFNVILVSAILITLALTWFAFPMMANTTTFQLDNTDATGADTYLDQEYPTFNYGSLAWIQVRSYSAAWGLNYTSPESRIYFFVVYNNKLYAGTAFNRRIYVYDGSSWSLSYTVATGNSIQALAVYNNKLYAGGDGGQIYVYDGSSWSQDATYTFSSDQVWSLAVYNSKLYAGTYQGADGGKIYVKDGTSAWALSGNLAEEYIHSLAVYNGNLYAGSGSNTGVGKVYVFNGSSWSLSYTVPGGQNVHSLAVYNNKLYAGTDYGGRIYVYDGSWTLNYDSPDIDIYALTVYNGRLYAGTYSNAIYVYDGSTWSLSYESPDSDIYCLAVYNNKLYAGSFAGKIYVLAYNNNRSILKFNIDSIPAGSTVTSATLKLKTNYILNATGRTYYAYRLKETNWVEGTAGGAVQTGSSCWDYRVYDTAAWAGGGGGGDPDGTYTTTDGASYTVPAQGNWMEWNVTNQVQYAIDNEIEAHFLIRDGTEDSATDCLVEFRGETYGADAPKLEVTYTAPATLTVSGSDVSSDMLPNTTNNEMLSIQLVASEGTITVTDMTFDFSGTAIAEDFPLGGIKLWNDLGTVGIYDAGTDTQVGSSQNFASSVTFSSMSYGVSTTTKNLLLTVDIDSDAITSHTLAATLQDNTHLTVTGGTVNSFDAISTAARTLPVTLSSFTAQFLNGVPTLYWRTMSETDNIGWYVYRNAEEGFTTSERITDYLIEGYGTTTEPHHYIYEDVELDGIQGETYWYWIESIDLGGAFHRYEPSVLTIPDIPHPEPNQNIPKQYGLHQNSPNPLSIGKETTKISFLLPKTARAEIKIYNIRGELVKDLYKGMAYGDDEVKDIIWDGRNENGIEQVTGIYLYQLKVNGKVYETKRLILLR